MESPQAGLGAWADSSTKDSESLVTTVEGEASSWNEFVTVTQLGAD